MNCNNVIVLGGGKLQYNGRLAGLAEYAAGRLWEWEASEHEWRAMAQEQLLTARRTEGGIRCRMIADEPPTPYARAVDPAMEDGYLALISRLTNGDTR